MATSDEAEKAERQARMSRALGAAFLAHQVNELERNVDTLSFRRGPAHPAQRGGRGSGHRGVRGGGGHRGGGPPAVTRAPVELAPAVAPPAQSSSPQRTIPKRVVDASALLHALPVIKQWIRTGSYQVIVPQEAIVTLDLLKKGTSAIALAARDATRYLDTQLELSASATDPRLVCEREGEAVDGTALDEMLSGHLYHLADEQKHLLPPSLLDDDDEEGASSVSNGDVVPSASQVVPRHLQPVLRFALHLSELARHPSEQPVIAYYAAPSETEDERDTGAGVAEWTMACGLASYEITADEVARSKEAAKAFHQSRQEVHGEKRRGPRGPRRRGGGGGSGDGRGRGRGGVRGEGSNGEPAHRKLFEP